jgi:phage/plasmid-associated DNA primase
MDIGICLYSLSNETNSSKYLTFWKQQTELYRPVDSTNRDCDFKWSTFTSKKYTIRSLYYWLRKDGVEFTNVNTSTFFLTELVYLDDLYPQDIAELFNTYMNIQFYVYDKNIYLFDNGKYLVINSSSKQFLKQKIFESCNKLIKPNLSHINKRVVEKCRDIIGRLKKMNSLNEIIGFIEMMRTLKKDLVLDTDFGLLGFEDGVLDIKTKTFHKNNPNLNVSMSCGRYYKDVAPYIEEGADFSLIMETFTSLYETKDLMMHELIRLGKSLTGAFDERFDIVIGPGSNGKGVLQHFIQKALGNYFVCVDSSTIENVKSNGGSASSDIVAMKNKRIAFINENSSSTLSSAMVKKFTSRDMVSARELYKSSENFILACGITLFGNSLQNPDVMDGGFTRRVKVVPYNRRFVDNPDPENPLECKIDYDLKQNMPDEFYNQLLAFLILCNDKPLPVCNLVEEATKNYLQVCDPLFDFCSKYIVEDKECILSFKEFKQIFNDYKRDDEIKNLNAKTLMDKQVLFNRVATHYKLRVIKNGKYHTKPVKNYIRGIKYQTFQEEL